MLKPIAANAARNLPHVKLKSVFIELLANPATNAAENTLTCMFKNSHTMKTVNPASPFPDTGYARGVVILSKSLYNFFHKTTLTPNR